MKEVTSEVAFKQLLLRVIVVSVEEKPSLLAESTEQKDE